MLIYEIVRHMVKYTNDSPDLMCKFSSGTEFVAVKAIWGDEDGYTVRKFKLDPETSINVQVPLGL